MEMIREHENWRSLHERLRGIAKRRAALDAEEARCLREACATKLWRQLGYAHMNEYLERELGYSPQVGVERLRVAHDLAELPKIEGSLGAGHLSFSAVRELTRVATAETEQEWLDEIRGKNLRQIEAMVSGKKRGDRPRDPSNPDLTMRVLRLELAPAVLALFRQTQGAMADEHGGRLDDSALIEVLCRRALESGGPADRPAYQLAITQCEVCGRGWQNGAGREIDVGCEVVERARCDAEILGSLEADEPERVRTTVTLRVRRQVFARDHYRCTVPGCRSARNLDIHHVEYQSRGGGHEIQNLTTLCSAHHAALHEDRLAIRGTAPDALEFSWREHIGPLEPGMDCSRHGDGRKSTTTNEIGPQPRSSGTVLPATTGIGAPEPSLDAPSPKPGADPPPTEDIGAREPSLDAPSRRPGAEPAPAEDIGAGEWGSALSSRGHRSPERNELTLTKASSLADASVRPATTRKAPHLPSALTRRPTEDLARRADAAVMNTATIDAEACLALTTAGYRSRDSRAAVERARPHVGASATLEQVIREALRQCPSVAAAFK